MMAGWAIWKAWKRRPEGVRKKGTAKLFGGKGGGEEESGRETDDAREGKGRRRRRGSMGGGREGRREIDKK